MYVQESLASERQRERLKQAQQERVARQVSEYKRLERRRSRAERQLMQAWRRVDQLRSTLGEAS